MSSNTEAGERKFRRHPLAIAWDYWRESEEGVKACDPTTLGPVARARHYLENRLQRAFQAGAAVSDTLCGNCGQRYVGPYEEEQHGIGVCK